MSIQERAIDAALDARARAEAEREQEEREDAERDRRYRLATLNWGIVSALYGESVYARNPRANLAVDDFAASLETDYGITIDRDGRYAEIEDGLIVGPYESGSVGFLRLLGRCEECGDLFEVNTKSGYPAAFGSLVMLGELLQDEHVRRQIICQDCNDQARAEEPTPTVNASASITISASAPTPLETLGQALIAYLRSEGIGTYDDE